MYIRGLVNCTHRLLSLKAVWCRVRQTIPQSGTGSIALYATCRLLLPYMMPPVGLIAEMHRATRGGLQSLHACIPIVGFSKMLFGLGYYTSISSINRISCSGRSSRAWIVMCLLGHFLYSVPRLPAWHGSTSVDRPTDHHRRRRPALFYDEDPTRCETRLATSAMAMS